MFTSSGHKATSLEHLPSPTSLQRAGQDLENMGFPVHAESSELDGRRPPSQQARGLGPWSWYIIGLQRLSACVWAQTVGGATGQQWKQEKNIQETTAQPWSHKHYLPSVPIPFLRGTQALVCFTLCPSTLA